MSDGNAEFCREFGVGGIAAEFGLQPGTQARQFVGLAADGGHIAFTVDDHQVTDDTRLVAVRIRICDVQLRHDARILRIGDVEYGGAELLLVGDVADVGVVALDVDLAGTRQVEMGQAFDVVGQRHARGIQDAFVHDVVAGASEAGIRAYSRWPLMMSGVVGLG